MLKESSTLLERLRDAVPGVRVHSDPDILETYRYDQAQFVEAGRPLAVALPRSTGEVQDLTRFAFDQRIPVVPRGAGSGLSGGANAIEGCIVLSLQNMNAILEVDASDQLAVVQPGVLNAELKREARAHGLHYPPDPASFEFSSIGGNVATNAGGLCCLKYGVTADYVLGLQVVLGDGTLLRTGRRTRKGVAGYDLTRLFVGSEGTLGVVTEATLRLRPPPPQAATIVVSFKTLEAVGRAITEITSSIVPSLLELLDRATMQAIEAWKSVGFDPDAEAVLLAQSEGAEADDALGQIERICVDAGADMVVRSSSPEESELLLEARRLAFPSLERQGNVLLDDVAVPPGQIATLLGAIPGIAHRNGVLVATFGHAGDGNMHPTIVFNAADEESTNAARAAFDEIVREALRLGGTITGEHGVGLLKRAYLPDEVGERAMGIHAALKGIFDPRGILNPGKGF